MKKYEKFSREELLQIFNNSCTFKEVSEKLGYINRKNKNIIIECAEKYHIPYEHLKSGKKEKWQYFSKEKIIEILNNSSSYNEALKSLGYITNDGTMNYKIDEIASFYKINLNHFVKTGDLSGKTFGKLLVLSKTERTDSSGQKYYKCQCNCSKKTIIEVSASSLRSGHTKSCGCLKSYGEFKVAECLSELKLPYIREYSFSDLQSHKGTKLRFDFFIPSINTLIECQGKQHYEYTGGFFNETDFKELQIRDSQKEIYCEAHNVRLLKIPYYDYKIISCEYLSKLLLLPNKA